MTVIAALVDSDGHAWVGADTQGTDDSGRVWQGTKLLRLGPNAVLGFSGDTRLYALAAQNLTWPPAPRYSSGWTTWAGKVARRIAELALDARPPVTASDGGVNGHALLACTGRLWHLSQDSASPVLERFCAVGSGANVALGALTALGDDTDAEQMLRRALEIACQWQCDCSPPLEVECAVPA